VLLTVGRVVRPHGIHGEVIVELHTDEPEQRFAVGAELITGVRRPGGAAGETAPPPEGVPPRLTVAGCRPHLGRLIASFEEVEDRNAAEALRDVLLQVDSATVPPPEDPDEYRDHQLVGLSAVTPGGERLGEVVEVDHAPASDLLVVRRPDGRTALVPFVTAIVPEVDLAGGRVVVDPPPGLLDL
jgi:16S rRNA processing protein RimM